MALLERLVVPVADEGDAVATAAALSEHEDDVGHVTAMHVVEKGAGVVDKAPMEKRRTDARAFLSTLGSRLDDELPVESRVVYGTNVAEAVVETALDVDATAIAFRPRGGSRLVRLLSGDTAARLVSDPAVPVVSLDAGDDPRPSPDRRAPGNAEVSG